MHPQNLTTYNHYSYWIALLQTKIQEIVHETEKLNKEKKNLDRETSAKKLYEKKVKEQAKELSSK